MLIVLTMVTDGNPRFRTPMDAIIVVLAGVPLAALVDRVQRQGRARRDSNPRPAD